MPSSEPPEPGRDRKAPPGPGQQPDVVDPDRAPVRCPQVVAGDGGHPHPEVLQQREHVGQRRRMLGPAHAQTQPAVGIAWSNAQPHHRGAGGIRGLDETDVGRDVLGRQCERVTGRQHRRVGVEQGACGRGPISAGEGCEQVTGVPRGPTIRAGPRGDCVASCMADCADSLANGADR